MINCYVYHYDQVNTKYIQLKDPINIVTIIESEIHCIKDIV